MEKTVRERANEILRIKDHGERERVYRGLLESNEAESFEILLKLLASGDVIHTQMAADILGLKADPRYLPKMREIRNQLPAHKGLRDYRWTVDRNIEILENIEQGAKCRCDLYEVQSGFGERFNPRVEQVEGFISIMREIVHREEYFTEYFCKCNTCGRRWRVTDEIGYHYSLYRWEEITDKRRYDTYF